MTSQEIYMKAKELFAEFEINHTTFQNKGTKAAGQRARKSLGELKKLVTDYRKASVEECKK